MKPLQFSLKSIALVMVVLGGILAIAIAWEKQCLNPDQAAEEQVAKLVASQGGKVTWVPLPPGPITWLSGRHASKYIYYIQLFSLGGPQWDGEKGVETLAAISSLKRINCLSLSAGDAPPDFQLPLVRLPASLEEINLFNLRVDDELLGKTQALQFLREASILYCDLQVSKAGIRRLPRSLKRLSIQSNDPGAWIEGLSQHPNLSYLDLSSCKMLSDDLIPSIIAARIWHIGVRPRHFSEQGRAQLKDRGIDVSDAGNYLNDIGMFPGEK